MTESNPLADRILGGDAPAHLKKAAARGALPLGRPLVARLQVYLLGDADPEIVAAARAGLDGLTSGAIREILSDASQAGEVLVHFAKRAAREEALAERVAFHPATPVSALGVLAATGSATIIDLVMTNEERLMTQPVLFERLMANPALRADQRGKILELLERADRLAGQRAAEEQRSAEAAGADKGSGEAGADDLTEAARLLEVDVGELLSASEIMGGEEFEESEDPDIRDAYRKILRLNTAQKALLAMKGNREERVILVRDSNRTVALGVLKNPRLTDPEIESMARMRNVHDEVLRQIGTAREWTKSYAVISALVNNPRTPQGVSMNFVSRLSTRDLRVLASNREVPELIRRMGRRTLDTRTQSQHVTFKKK